MATLAKESQHIWYVEPLNSHTNEVFSKELPHENFQRGVRCADNKIHNLWICPDFQAVQSFWDSRTDLSLKFRVFSAFSKGKKTRSARISECTLILFHPRKKK